jgi:hypothetical protein
MGNISDRLQSLTQCRHDFFTAMKERYLLFLGTTVQGTVVVQLPFGHGASEKESEMCLFSKNKDTMLRRLLMISISIIGRKNHALEKRVKINLVCQCYSDWH